MTCDNCSASGETRYVTFNQNVGMLVIRQTNKVEGHLCKNCINRYFWKMTLVNLVLGWWGLISFFVNFFYIMGNILEYSDCAGMQAPKKSVPAAKGPQLSRFAEERIAQHDEELKNALEGEEDGTAVLERISDKAIVPVSEVRLYAIKYNYPVA